MTPRNRILLPKTPRLIRDAIPDGDVLDSIVTIDRDMLKEATDVPPKRPRDPNQLAKMMVDIASGEITQNSKPTKSVNAFARIGGLKGGKARAAKLAPEERSAIAKLAAKKRWQKESTD